MTDPTPEHLDELLADGLPEHLAVVTLAPERPHAIEAIRRLVAAGVVVSLGHSDATAAETRAAVEAGASLVTHIFNAQRAVDRREPGLPGVALVEPRLALGLIADHHHLAPEIVQLVFLAGNGRVVLVTDAVAAAGMPAGRYQLGGTATYVHPEDRVPRREDGTLAGSSLSLDEAVRTVVGLGVEPAVALEAATRVPADVLGDHERGRLEPGSLADLVWWSDDLTVRRTWVGGEVAWSA
jgi:N-acetylglucosamine-6-phosphate deacetylase